MSDAWWHELRDVESSKIILTPVQAPEFERMKRDRAERAERARLASLEPISAKELAEIDRILAEL